MQSGRQVLTVAQQQAVSVKENRTFDLMGRKLRSSNLHFEKVRGLASAPVTNTEKAVIKLNWGVSLI